MHASKGPAFETQGRRHQKFKTGVSGAQQKELMSSKNKKRDFTEKNEYKYSKKKLNFCDFWMK